MSEENNNQPNNAPAEGGNEPNNSDPNPAPALPSQQQKPTPEVDPELMNDPGYKQWVEDTKDMSTAYKRYADSSKEAKSKAEELEKARETLSEREEYINSVQAELDQVFEANPELKKQFSDAYQKMQNGELPTKQDLENKPNDPKSPELDELRSEVDYIKSERRAKMKANIDNFRSTYKEYIADENDWKTITTYAEGLYGKPGRNGQPMNEVAALTAALQIQHPEIRDDQVRLRTLAEQMNRDSASTHGDMPGGTSGGSANVQLTQSEQRAAAGFGMTPEEYAKWKAQPSE